MTVTYSLNVSNARLCGFAKLLIRWRGSIYKLLYREMIIFCMVYYSLSGTYRYLLSEPQRRVFEKLSIYCETFTNLIPLSFVLGFYVSIVVGRWWQQYMSIPWPDKCSMLIAGLVHGHDERGRMTRRTLARYLILLAVLTFQAISTAVKKRFPTLDHLEEAGLMTKEERYMYDSIPVTHGKWWVPAQWFTSLACRARREGRIKDDILLKSLLDELHVFRGNCGMLFSYDWISIPLVYTQVVTIAIYAYFFATVMGRQYLDPLQGYPGHEIDLYIPIFTLLQFFFYMGWLKVAEQLINPFGEDDDDFELNWCLDRDLQIVFVIVDEMHQIHPKLIRDAYWDETEPQLPYTKMSVNLRSHPHLGSAINLDINPEESEFVPLETISEEDHGGHHYNSPPTSPTKELLHMDDNSSQAGLRFLSDSPGYKIMNMLMSSSQDNIQLGSSKKDLSYSLASPFAFKTPSHRSRTSSMNDCCELNIEDEGIGAYPLLEKPQHYHHNTDTAYPTTGYEEQRSLMMNVDDSSVIACFEANGLDKVDIPTIVLERHDDKADENSVKHHLLGGHNSVMIQMESEPLPTIQESGHSDASSSQESLTQISDSNQSTVSSIAQLIK